jgi:hypothetical protein
MTRRENGIGLMECKIAQDKIGQNRKVQQVQRTVGTGFCSKRIRKR